MRFLAAAAISVACAMQTAAAQSSFPKDRTLGSIMHGDPDRRKNVLFGLAEAFSKAHPTLRLSLLTKCLEDAADMPANWTKDVGPFAKECAERQR
ncbi:hypothetical protein GU700_17180 [Methylobacterium sp. NI91]|nr:MULTISPECIES: hypothetical protein [unclassified Methylobacterium]QIJ76172.1 hypothetical protein CLZ_17175 [Methylobacterium sp. CLZ]QIJ81077.1 hypothetical protein GU700_17180 [Methylobacterium sp. NI91]